MNHALASSGAKGYSGTDTDIDRAVRYENIDIASQVQRVIAKFVNNVGLEQGHKSRCVVIHEQAETGMRMNGERGLAPAGLEVSSCQTGFMMARLITLQKNVALNPTTVSTEWRSAAARLLRTSC